MATFYYHPEAKIPSRESSASSMWSHCSTFQHDVFQVPNAYSPDNRSLAPNSAPCLGDSSFLEAHADIQHMHNYYFFHCRPDIRPMTPAPEDSEYCANHITAEPQACSDTDFRSPTYHFRTLTPASPCHDAYTRMGTSMMEDATTGYQTIESPTTAPQAIMFVSSAPTPNIDDGFEIEEDAIGDSDHESVPRPPSPRRRQQNSLDTTASALNTGASDDDSSTDVESDAAIMSANDSDADYQPGKTSQPRRCSTVIKARGKRKPSATKATSRIEKPTGRRTSIGRNRSNPTIVSSRSAFKAASKDKPFICPLTPYGCQFTFTSKNEWKRHITVQHLALFVYHCDQCTEHESSSSKFNRKDLFKSHLSRMHYKNNDELLNKHLDEIQARCLIKNRDPPTQFFDVFEDRPYNGSKNNVDGWLEHLAKKLSSIRGGANTGPLMEELWKKDHLLRDWLLKEGLLERKDDCWSIKRLHDRPNADRERSSGTKESDAVADSN